MITKFLRILLNESGMDGMYQFAPGERHVELVAAQSQVASLVAAYDALAPDWSQAPDWAEWATMFDNGKVIFWELEPKCIFLSYEWVWKEKDEKIGLTISRMSSELPLGIDWRLCKWQRPEVAK